jgi:hypothetical protein
MSQLYKYLEASQWDMNLWNKSLSASQWGMSLCYKSLTASQWDMNLKNKSLTASDDAVSDLNVLYKSLLASHWCMNLCKKVTGCITVRPEPMQQVTEQLQRNVTWVYVISSCIHESDAWNYGTRHCLHQRKVTAFNTVMHEPLHQDTACITVRYERM